MSYMHPEVERVRREMFGNQVFEQMVLDGMFEAVTVCPPEERAVRDEYARESSVEFQLKQFTAGQAFPQRGASGVDFGLDLLESHELMSRAQVLWRQAAPEVRAKFPDVGAFWVAVGNGEYDAFLAGLEAARKAKEAPVS